MAEADHLLSDVLVRRRKTVKPDSPPLGRRPRHARPVPAESGEAVGGRAAVTRRSGDPREGDARRLEAVQRHEPAGRAWWPRAGCRGRAAGRRRLRGEEGRELRIPVPESSSPRGGRAAWCMYEAWDKYDQAANWKAKVGMPTCPPTPSLGRERKAVTAAAIALVAAS